jgi:hypothetical protein
MISCKLRKTNGTKIAPLILQQLVLRTVLYSYNIAEHQLLDNFTAWLNAS